MSTTHSDAALAALSGITVSPDPEEIAAGRLGDQHLQRALRTFREAGLVVLEQAYPPAWIAAFGAAYDRGLHPHMEALGGPEVMPTFGPKHIGWHPPLTGAFADPLVVAPPLAVQLLEALIGADFCCPYAHTNTAWPGSGFQPIHRDDAPLFGHELSVAHPPVSVVVNIAVDEFTVENGATEVWPGSHLVPDREARDASEVPERAATMPSIRTVMPAGSLVLRDLRCYHRGVPNRTGQPRRMTAFVYVRPWKRSERLRLPRATWNAWPQRVQRIFRFNDIVDDAGPETAS